MKKARRIIVVITVCTAACGITAAKVRKHRGDGNIYYCQVGPFQCVLSPIYTTIPNGDPAALNPDNYFTGSASGWCINLAEGCNFTHPISIYITED